MVLSYWLNSIWLFRMRYISLNQWLGLYRIWLSQKIYQRFSGKLKSSYSKSFFWRKMTKKSQKQSFDGVLQNMFLKISQVSQKTRRSVSLNNKIAGCLEPTTWLKKRTRIFSYLILRNCQQHLFYRTYPGDWL